MTLPKDISKINLSNAQYMALSIKERNRLSDELASSLWEYYSEANPEAEKPVLPCVIDGVIIGE